MSKKKLLHTFDNLPPKSIHDISKVFFNMQYLTDKVNDVRKNKLIDSMRKNKKHYKYISSKCGSIKRKRVQLKTQVGTGLVSLFIASAIPLISEIVRAARG